MPRFCFPRCAAMGVIPAIAAACMALPVFADTPITVTFAPNSVWAQEIGSVSHTDNAHDYTVAIAAAKTLQLNLISRNPNVYFKVKDQTRDKQLVDTLKTGVSTWSLPNLTATTYMIHVYIVPDTIERGDNAKYALQIGQFGAEDMRPATTAVTFEANKPWVQEDGSLEAGTNAHNFAVSIAAGKTLQVKLVTSNPALHFKVEDQTHDMKLVYASKTVASTWSTQVGAATTYAIQVYVDPAAIPPGQKVQYSLQIGQHGSEGAKPANLAGSTTATLPGAATSMSPAAATTHR